VLRRRVLSPSSPASPPLASGRQLLLASLPPRRLLSGARLRALPLTGTRPLLPLSGVPRLPRRRAGKESTGTKRHWGSGVTVA
jgi:hypothetical protein